MSASGRFDFDAPAGFCPEGECSSGLGYAVFTQKGAVEAGRYAQPDLQKVNHCNCLRERLRFHDLPPHRTRDGAIERLADALCWDDIAALAFWRDVRSGSLWVRPQVANLVFGMGTPRPPSFREPEESRRAHAAVEALHALATADHARAVANLYDDEPAPEDDPEPHCSACGREETDCILSPCAAVLADRARESKGGS